MHDFYSDKEDKEYSAPNSYSVKIHRNQKPD